MEAGRGRPALGGEGLRSSLLGSAWAALGVTLPRGIQSAAEQFPPGIKGGEESRICLEEAQLPRRRHHEDTGRGARGELETELPSAGSPGGGG